MVINLNINQITINRAKIDDLDQSLELVEEFLSTIPNNSSSVDTVINGWKELMQKDSLRCYLAHDGENNLLGISCNRPQDSAITFLFVKTKIIEKFPDFANSLLAKLFSAAFNDIKSTGRTTISFPLTKLNKPILTAAGFAAMTRSFRLVLFICHFLFKNRLNSLNFSNFF